MAKYSHSDVLDGGLNAIKNSATKMLLIKAYSAADSYATVVAAKIAEVTMTSSDYTLSGSDGAARVLTTASGKSATASANSGATPNLHIAFTNGTDKVLWVTDETSDQVVTSGNTVNFPSITYTSSQPT
jgi:hypothetical protein